MFGKWFASTYTGSMLGAGGTVFAVWGWIIANADCKGTLEINPRLLSAIIGDPIEDVEKALEYLSQPDPNSRSKEQEGRRIVHVNAFTWEVVNHEHYRKIRNADERREYNRRKKAEARARAKSADSQQSQPRSTQAEAEAESEVSKSRRVAPPADAPKVLTHEEVIGLELAQYLFDAIRSHSPDFLAGKTPEQIERKLTGWAKPLRLIVTKDGRTPEQVKSAIRYVHQNEARTFWRSNILSGSKLREKLPALSIEARQHRGPKGFTVPDDVREGTVFA